MQNLHLTSQGIDVKLKTITASAFLLAFLSGCSANSHDSESSNLKRSHIGEIPTTVSIGSETAKSYFLFEVESHEFPDKEFTIYSDDFTEQQSFDLCPEVKYFNCNSHIQILGHSKVNNLIRVDFLVKYFESVQDSPYESGPDELFKFPIAGGLEFIEPGKRTLIEESSTNNQWLKSVYVTYKTQ